MISAVAKTSGASIDEVKYHNYFFKVTKLSKKWILWPKTHLLIFALFVRNFSNKHHNILLKTLRRFCFWYFCPKLLFPKLFVLKVDLGIKVVALIKIPTVHVKSLAVSKVWTKLRTHLLYKHAYSSVRKEGNLNLWIITETLHILA